MTWKIMVFVWLTLLSGLCPARAAPPGVNLEVFPATLKPFPGMSLEVAITVRNSTSKALQDLTLSWFTDVNDLKVICKEGHLKLPELKPEACFTWLVGITKETAEPLEGQISFRLVYSSESVAGVAFSKLEIKPRASPEMDKIAELTILKSTLQRLQEYQEGVILLLVKNKSEVPLTITSLDHQQTKFIKVTVPELGAGKLLQPRESQILEVKAQPADQTYPGKYLLVFDVGLKWEESGMPKTGRLVASHEVDVGIVGESEVLKLLGVPSFLILPGFLMVTCAIWIRRRFPPQRAAASEVKSPEFWLLAISLSILAGWLYPVITSLFKQPRNYLVGYGLKDVIWVWFGSIVVGGFLGFVWASAAKWIAPSALDGPLRTLLKLWLARASYPPAIVEIKWGNETRKGFHLREYAGGKIWVSPAIRWQWDPKQLAAFEDHRKFVRELKQARGYISLRSKFYHVYNKLVDIGWKQTGSFQGLTLVDQEDLTSLPREPYYEEDLGFKEADTPIKVLYKLALADFTPLKAWWAKPGFRDIRCFIISDPLDGKRWVIPPIFFHWDPSYPDPHADFLTSLDEVQTPRELVELIEEGHSQKWIKKLFWGSKDLKTPLLVDGNQLKEGQPTLKIVEEE